MPLDLSDVADDADLGEAFCIIRTPGQFALGEIGWQASEPVRIPIWGTWSVTDGKRLQRVPEGDRVTGSMNLVTATEIHQTSEARSEISDQLEWRGNMYRIISVEPWGDYGYWSAVFVRMTGS